MQDHDISSVKTVERPSSFEDLMRGRNIPVVQVHDAMPVGEGIVGFCEKFEWKSRQFRIGSASWS